jgi:hypothetical protein
MEDCVKKILTIIVVAALFLGLAVFGTRAFAEVLGIISIRGLVNASVNLPKLCFGFASMILGGYATLECLRDLERAARLRRAFG